METRWTTVRASLSAVSAEGTTAPSSTVSLDQPGPRLEVRVRGASLGGSPGTVTLGVWRGSQGSFDKLGTIEIAAADIASPIPQLFELNGLNVWITVESFAGGSTPTFTGSIDARPVFGA